MDSRFEIKAGGAARPGWPADGSPSGVGIGSAREGKGDTMTGPQREAREAREAADAARQRVTEAEARGWPEVTLAGLRRAADRAERVAASLAAEAQP